MSLFTVSFLLERSAPPTFKAKALLKCYFLPETFPNPSSSLSREKSLPILTSPTHIFSMPSTFYLIPAFWVKASPPLHLISFAGNLPEDSVKNEELWAENTVNVSSYGSFFPWLCHFKVAKLMWEPSYGRNRAGKQFFKNQSGRIDCSTAAFPKTHQFGSIDNSP